jgi:O-methyltransferase
MIKTLARGINFLAGRSLRNRHIFMGASLDYLQRKRTIDKNYFDYIRLSSLELVSHEINAKGLKGNVAELGVYKGKFAKFINAYFPGRTLYLFDTFAGFDQRDIAKERNEKLSTGEQDFSDTSVDAVLKLMPFPGQCQPVKGFFPESAKNIDDVFVFVSLDADLYEPIYNGLQFFYSRLTKGGYIFIHDFNNDEYKGSRKAVEQFCSEQNIGYMPLPDAGGSAVIVK